MRVLLDTCTFLWAVSAPEELSATAKPLLTDPGNEVFLSAVSAWEICVKNSLGTLDLAEAAAQFIPKYRELHGYRELPLDEASVIHLPRLPTPHKDPFDRMLVCQAIAHGLVILTPDPKITQYPVRVLW